MIRFLTPLAIGAMAALPALAQPSGDPVAGEAVFRQCQTCHVVVDDEGNTLAGRSARTGPNLYGIADRKAGSVEDFRYGKDIVAAGEKGLAWDEEHIVPYLQDTTGFLRDYLDNPKARSRMTYKIREEEDARDVWAYLVSLGGGGAGG